MNLDHTTLGDHIHNIGIIYLDGRGDNTLTPTSEALLSLSDSTDNLKVHGNNGGHIVVQDGGWVGVGYKVSITPIPRRCSTAGGGECLDGVCVVEKRLGSLIFQRAKKGPIAKPRGTGSSKSFLEE